MRAHTSVANANQQISAADTGSLGGAALLHHAYEEPVAL